jgi:ABC-type transport system involved in multi-copper enzyme maturation permease subunit
LVVLQFAAAIPWLVVVLLPAGREVSWRRQLFAAENLVRNFVVAGIVLVCGIILGAVLWQFQDGPSLEWYGRVYGAILHFQVIVDFFVLSLAGLLLVWPKGAAVALAAFREGFRQPMFWLLLLLGLVLMTLFPLVPYFTLGDDQAMVKEMGYETIMLFTLIFGVMTASMSIADEIEGRTAITLMSKPVSRRQFLLGKFVGIYLSGLVLVGLLGWFFNWMVLFKQWLAPLEGNVETVQPPLAFVDNWVRVLIVNHLVPPDASPYFLRGGFLWLADTLQNLPGLILGSCQIMVLLALAVALATRATMIINLVTCLAVYVMGHLSPVLLEIARQRLREAPNAAGPRLLSFVASLLSAVLPGSEYFNISPALATDSPPPLPDFYPYVGEVVLYALLYTSIVLIVGLFAFEDRDLA